MNDVSIIKNKQVSLVLIDAEITSCFDVTSCNHQTVIYVLQHVQIRTSHSEGLRVLISIYISKLFQL